MDHNTVMKETSSLIRTDMLSIFNWLQAYLGIIMSLYVVIRINRLNWGGNLETVSVIMPCYNDGKYIGQAVESIKLQTYQHIELIIADDGSDDKETLYALKDISFPNKKIIQTNHVGPAIARSKCIAAASGSFILPLDADDIIDSTYIEKAVKVLEDNPAIGIVYCQAAFFGEKSGKWELPKFIRGNAAG